MNFESEDFDTSAEYSTGGRSLPDQQALFHAVGLAQPSSL
jgi:hypothetical protein